MGYSFLQILPIIIVIGAIILMSVLVYYAIQYKRNLITYDEGTEQYSITSDDTLSTLQNSVNSPLLTSKNGILDEKSSQTPQQPINTLSKLN